jgi:error-prone DNA polymerase
MVHPYLRRRNGEEKVVYPHPCLEPVLKKTLGVPLFQEQVMRLAVVAADYTPGESDQLRRDMAAWRKSGRIEQHRERLISRMQKKGIALEFAERVFQQICGFGEYGFPESHAASFALISYVGAWLRRHHTAEFTCGLLNSLPMGFYSAATIVDDAKRHGVEFRPIDVCASEWDSTLEPCEGNGTRAVRDDFALRMGLRFVKQLGFGEWTQIERARRAAPFTSLTDFRLRVPLRSTSARALAESGALESLEHGRREALWRTSSSAETSERVLFSSDDADTPAFRELTESETVRWDYQSSHHSVRNHPLATLRAELTAAGLPDAKRIATLGTDEVVRYAGLVICRQRPGTASGVTFMTLEDESGFVNLIFYRDVFERFAVLGKTQGFLGVTGRVQNENGVVHVLVSELWVPAIALQVVEVGSRDFH